MAFANVKCGGQGIASFANPVVIEYCKLGMKVQICFIINLIVPVEYMQYIYIFLMH